MSNPGVRKSKVSRANSTDPADPLADLFGFAAAQKRLQEEQNQRTSANIDLGFQPWRVFLNHMDSYHGRRMVEVEKLSKYITYFSFK